MSDVVQRLLFLADPFLPMAGLLALSIFVNGLAIPACRHQCLPFLVHGLLRAPQSVFTLATQFLHRVAVRAQLRQPRRRNASLGGLARDVPRRFAMLAYFGQFARCLFAGSDGAGELFERRLFLPLAQCPQGVQGKPESFHGLPSFPRSVSPNICQLCAAVNPLWMGCRRNRRNGSYRRIA